MATEQAIQQAANDYGMSRITNLAKLVRIHEQAQRFEHEQWAEDISELIQEMPLSVEMVAIYPQREECEWEILLGTGGPADRVLVTTDFAGDTEDAIYQYQDWGTPWTQPACPDYYDQLDNLRAFAGHFYFEAIAEWTARNWG